MKEVTILVFLVLLCCVAYLDWKTMIIPDWLVGMLLVCGEVSIKTVPGLSLGERILGLFSASGILFAIGCFYPGAFGGGDIKLMAVCGLFLGWKKILLALYFAVLAAGLCVIILLWSGRKGISDSIPFGPFLTSGMVVSFFTGDWIMSWYLKLSGMR